MTMRLEHYRLISDKILFQAPVRGNGQVIANLNPGMIVSLLEIQKDEVWDDAFWWNVIAGDQVGWLIFRTDYRGDRPQRVKRDDSRE